MGTSPIKTIKNIPLRIVVKLYFLFRSIFYRVKKPSHKSFYVDLEVEELREILGGRYFTNKWELSYKYRGEVLNMRRCFYKDDEYKWYQLHVRAWVTEDDNLEIMAHIELTPTDYPRGHINEINMDIQEGISIAKEELRREGIMVKDREEDLP